MRAVPILVLFGPTALAQDKFEAHGKAWEQEYLRRYKPADDPAMTAYVARVAQPLAEVAGLNEPVVVRIFDTPDFEASMMGRYVLVSTEMIRTAPDEGAFIARLAHHVAHSRHEIRGLFSIPLRFACSGTPGRRLLGIPERVEREVDEMALHYLAATGFQETGEFVALRQKVEARPRITPPSLYKPGERRPDR